ncbi:MAG: polysaccharide deacetylase family protein [Desulfotomaculaceae bacterium]|nr:polysaccharide deacetylase family protein [Desulfotomaculaceae bacterium]MDD4766559.1 polysaccharide deacetylase family protein [Desulfotomaculaceae bacterium]
MDTALFLKIVFLCVFIYSLAPTLLIRLGRVGAVARAARGYGRVALTFDDGPDPNYTPQILDILKQYQVKACFFVVGSKVRLYPDLTRQILQAGHTIGNHGFRHKAVWLLSPGATRGEINETNMAIEEITGQKTVFFRPAWGLFNAFLVWYCRLKGQKVILWTYMSWDWTKKATPESICRKVLGRLKDGAIIILHDSDSALGAAKGSPAQVVAALPRILDGIEEKGLRVSSLEDIIISKKKPFLRKLFQQLWLPVDKLARRLSGITDLPDSKIWRIALRRHRGREWAMHDSSVLKPGELYLELHVNNDRLMELIDENTSVERASIIAMREVLNGLPPLVEYLNSEKKLENVDIVMGITLLHRGLGRIGFTVADMKPGLFKAFTGWYERWLLGVFHPGGFKKLKTYREKLTPKYVIMTRQELTQKNKTNDKHNKI